MSSTMTSTDESSTVTLSRDAVNGRAVGALFFIGFGAVWMFAGLRSVHHASRTALVALALASVVLLVCTALLMRRAATLAELSGSPEEEIRAERMFTAVNIIQWVSVATAIAILNILRLPVYIAPAVAIIVGLHLFPLAGAFHNRQHYVTGSLLVAWPLGCMALLPRERVSGTCATGVGFILLLSASVSLWRCTTALRYQTAVALPAGS